MLTASLLALAVLWVVVLHQYPAFFIPRKSAGFGMNQPFDGENWIEVTPASQHNRHGVLQEVA